MIKINYKGTSCRGTEFLYICPVCKHEQKATHAASEEPLVRCDKCQHCMNKKPTAVNLDADQHQDSLSYNIGWDYDGTKE
jgi:hypothetical protein